MGVGMGLGVGRVDVSDSREGARAVDGTDRAEERFPARVMNAASEKGSSPPLNVACVVVSTGAATEGLSYRVCSSL